MKNHTLGVSIFSHANNMGKFSQHEPNLKFVEGLRRSASINGVKILQDKYPPNVAAMLENREKKTTLSDCQLFVGWYTVDVNKNDSDVTNTLVRLCMHTVYRSRDYFARFQFNLRQLSLGTGDIFEFETFKSAAEWKYKYDKKKKGCKCKFKFGPYVIGSEVPNPPRYPAPLCDPINYVDVANGKTVNEDDILHEDLLKDFNGNISQEEAEQLYTYLTTPYMRIPLIVNFFSRERVGCLFDPDLQSLLEQTLFVPGIWGKLNVDDGRNVESVPCKPELLNTNPLMPITQCQPHNKAQCADVLLQKLRTLTSDASLDLVEKANILELVLVELKISSGQTSNYFSSFLHVDGNTTQSWETPTSHWRGNRNPNSSPMFQAKMSGGGISGKVDCGALVVPCCQIIFMFSPHVATLHIHLVHVLHGSSPGRNEHSMVRLCGPRGFLEKRTMLTGGK